jgi:hypothetical protein
MVFTVESPASWRLSGAAARSPGTFSREKTVSRFLTILTCVGAALSASVLRADGLIYRLPPDGAWAGYDVHVTSQVQTESNDPRELKLQGTLMLSSVGQVTVDKHACRWIEIKQEIAPVARPKQMISRALKLLIPERHLARGEDPLAHVLKMYYSQKGPGLPAVPVERIAESATIDRGYSRRQYELDRFRSIFPQPFEDMKREKQTVDTKLGRVECEKVSGTSDLPKAPLRGGGEWAWKGKFDCFLSEKAPFGVVGLESNTKGYETHGPTVHLETEMILTISESGGNATSGLPDMK